LITKLTPDQVWQFKIRAVMACDLIQEKCISKYKHIIGCHHYFNRVIDAFDDGVDPYFNSPFLVTSFIEWHSHVYCGYLLQYLIACHLFFTIV